MKFLIRLFRPLLVRFGEKALEIGLNYLETKYPLSKTIVDLILRFLEDAKADDCYELTANELRDHVADFPNRDV